MELCVCAVYDRQAGVYGRPMVVAAKGLAIRSFIDEVNRVSAENVMSAHPEDFSLYVLGVYVDDTGELVSQKPEMIMSGAAAAEMRK